MTGSWRTTVLGVLTILVAVAGAAKAFLTGEPVDYGVVVTSITVGIGLVVARDNKVSSEEAGAK